MKPIPTDLALLDAIYNRYYDVFDRYDDEDRSKNDRSSKLFVPIDIVGLGKQLDVDEDIVFGRLYYHLNRKFSYKEDDGSHVQFFAMRIGQDRHCVNFPYLASVLADLRDADKKHRTSTTIAVFSALISVVAVIVSVIVAGGR